MMLSTSLRPGWQRIDTAWQPKSRFDSIQATSDHATIKNPCQISDFSPRTLGIQQNTQMCWLPRHNTFACFLFYPSQSKKKYRWGQPAAAGTDIFFIQERTSLW